MVDYSELKKLAETFPSDLDWDSNTEPFFNGPTGESLGGGADGTYTVYGKPFQLPGEDYDYDGPTYVDRCGIDFAKFMVSARDGVLALIAESEHLTESRNEAREERNKLGDRYDQLKAENDGNAKDFLAFGVVMRSQADKVDQLKAENAGLKTGYEAYERVNAELKAESEALRDDIEQNQYDANAWRNGEESVWIEVFNSEGDDPFISAITGQITVEQLALIQAEILEYREDYFEKGSGLYVFRCAHHQAHHDNVGMTEPAHWETDFESYSPFPWEEEDAAMGKGEQS